MFNLNFNIDGEQQFNRYLDIAADSVSDFSSIFELLADDFRETQESVFKNSGAFEGRTAWKQLSPIYKKWKQKKVGSKPILTFSGKMRRSLTLKGATNSIVRIDKNKFEIGTNDPKAIFHQKGTRKMPKRKVIDLTEPQKRRWVRIAHDELFRLMSASESGQHQSGNFSGRR